LASLLVRSVMPQSPFERLAGVSSGKTKPSGNTRFWRTRCNRAEHSRRQRNRAITPMLPGPVSRAFWRSAPRAPWKPAHRAAAHRRCGISNGSVCSWPSNVQLYKVHEVAFFVPSPPPWLMSPTMAWPPSFTVTCRTLMVCSCRSGEGYPRRSAASTCAPAYRGCFACS
jgi:hypothetical protein